MDRMKRGSHQDGERGFSLIETIVAMSILATGLLGLAGVFGLGMAHLAGSSASLVAREKAREAVETVHSARDMRMITWAQIRNVSDGGVFLDGAQPLKVAGVDGLVNTADDGALETSLAPGVDGLWGTADDVKQPLSSYTREIAIDDIVTGGVTNLTLRQITITIRYKVGQMNRTYVLTTYVSQYS
jgi:prepilin-type N-terminal cleavage/methylation domain-containing protein